MSSIKKVSIAQSPLIPLLAPSTPSASATRISSESFTKPMTPHLHLRVSHRHHQQVPRPYTKLRRVGVTHGVTIKLGAEGESPLRSTDPWSLANPISAIAAPARNRSRTAPPREQVAAASITSETRKKREQ